jgi:hypothetical protein
VKETKAELKHLAPCPRVHITQLKHLSRVYTRIGQLVIKGWDCMSTYVLMGLFELVEIDIVVKEDIATDSGFFNCCCPNQKLFSYITRRHQVLWYVLECRILSIYLELRTVLREHSENGNLQLKINRVKLLNQRTNVMVETETFAALEVFQDQSKSHIFTVTIANLVKNTKGPRCHFSWPRGSTLLNKDRRSQLDIVIAKDVDP